MLTREGERQLDYLNSVLDELERAETDRDLSDIRRELTETGYIRARKGGKAERVKPQSPLKFVSDDGLEILAGRSNAQNDELTLKSRPRARWSRRPASPLTIRRRAALARCRWIIPWCATCASRPALSPAR